MAEQWYDNKELYEMMVNLSKGLEHTNAELAKTQVMIRDYNGLREKVDKVEKRQDQHEAQDKGGKEMWGYAVGGIGVVVAVIALLV